jgi:hypothetical protein
MESSRGPPRVKNKAAAPVQISAEQLLREAVDRQDTGLQKPTQRFADLEELKEYQGRKRREFEDYIRRNRVRLANWFQYAQWELEQKEFARARSVFERALDVHPNNTRMYTLMGRRGTACDFADLPMQSSGSGTSKPRSRTATSTMLATSWIAQSPGCRASRSSGTSISGSWRCSATSPAPAKCLTAG